MMLRMLALAMLTGPAIAHRNPTAVEFDQLRQQYQRARHG